VIVIRLIADEWSSPRLAHLCRRFPAVHDAPCPRSPEREDSPRRRSEWPGFGAL